MFRGALHEFGVDPTTPPPSGETQAEQHPVDWHVLYHAAGISALAVAALIPVQGICLLTHNIVDRLQFHHRHRSNRVCS